LEYILQQNADYAGLTVLKMVPLGRESTRGEELLQDEQKELDEDARSR